MLPLLFAMAAASLSPSPSAVFADTLYLDGKIWAGKGLPFARALAVREGTILAIGNVEDVSRFKGPETLVVSLKGRFVVPGFNDAHAHVLGAGESLMSIDLRKTRSEAEMMQALASYIAAQPAQRWITRGRWDHEVWGVKKLPSRKSVDSVSTHNPVLLPRVDGHMALANTLALKAAGITRDTPDPSGGSIEKDEQGEPTGILKDNAIELVQKLVPEPSFQEEVEAVRTALRELARMGVTSIQDNSAPAALRAYVELMKRKELTARISVWRDMDGLASYEKGGITGGLGNDWVRLDAIKMFIDGSMGAGSAAFFEPYADEPGNRGLLVTDPAVLAKTVNESARAGFTVAVHAIGDRGNALVLDAFETLRKSGAFPDTRLRIEHAQVVRSSDVARFRALGVIASIQPCHALTDMQWAAKRIGKERLENGYRIASFLKEGVSVAFGTDWPVEPVDPRRGLFAAVARRFPDDPSAAPWSQHERISLEEALDLYTRGSAAAEGTSSRKGTLQAGKLADFTVFSEDLFAVEKKDPRGLLDVPVVMTVVGGKTVYEKGGPS